MKELRTYFYHLVLLLTIVQGAAIAQFGQHISFHLTDDPIDVVIPAKKCKTKGLLDISIDSIRKYGSRIRDVYVVSPTKLTEKAIWIDEKSFPFDIDSVRKHLFQDEKKEAEYYDALAPLKKRGRIGWYLQQLLKLYSPLVIPNISSNVLILDSDVVFLQPVEFLNDKNEPLFCLAGEYWKPYFAHASKLMPGFSRYFKEVRPGSGVTHHMIMQRDPIIQMFKIIESTHGVPAWQAMCHCVDTKNGLPGSGFSEYEIYFNFIMGCSTQGHIRNFKWKNAQQEIRWDDPKGIFEDLEKFRSEGFVFVAKH